ncbi:HemY protein [Methylohalomonas lacus]|uniref:HemY protein n=1 Tax=Methylohalomonas lacus TaxID=398773 RepID=A0AAE3HIX7_9GAMM|nr:heme biosynthesis HemY N-terminal domain-containing protein [Methylohalomonas lacus]MCS3903231.1 HemY protein [Methylohalomonas lacus]
MRLPGIKILFLILLALAVAVAIGLFAHDYPGHMVLRLPGWRIETSFSFFVVALLVTIIVVVVLLRLVTGLWRLPGRALRWRADRRRLRGEGYMRRGLLALIEGDWKRAEKMLQKGAGDSRAPLINYLAAARAAQEQGDLERRDNYLRLAHQHSPNADIIIGIAQAELQMNQQQTEQALATLKHLYDRKPDQGHIQQMLVQTYSQVGDWESVLQLLPQLAKNRLISTEQRRDLELKAYIGLLQRAGSRRQRESIDAVWRDTPRKLRDNPQLLAAYVTECIRVGHTDGCEALLKSALKKQWSAQLMELYSQIESADPIKQLDFAEKFLDAHPQNAPLLLAVGRLSLRCGLWGKAKAYLIQSIDARAEPETYRELADLLRQQGEHAEASRYYQQGLIAATGGARQDGPLQIEGQRV